MDQGDYVPLVTAVHGEHLHDIPHDNFGPGDDHVGIVEAGRALGASGLISCYGLGLFHHQLIEHTHSSGFNSHQCGAMINWYNMKVKAQVRIDRVGTMCFWCGLLLWCGFDWCATLCLGSSSVKSVQMRGSTLLLSVSRGT